MAGWAPAAVSYGPPITSETVCLFGASSRHSHVASSGVNSHMREKVEGRGLRNQGRNTVARMQTCA